VTPTGALRIEPASVASVDLLAELHRQAFTADEQVWTPETFAELLAMPGALAWLAVESTDGGDQPRGFALVRFVVDEGEIITIGVLPEARRHGVARLLLAGIIGHARNVNASLFLEVAANNEPALRLYLDNGFIEAGRRKDYYKRREGNNVDALVLKKAALIS
jgi:[ribosomal protein S18]-alanine N-acetyltransferase